MLKAAAAGLLASETATKAADTTAQRQRAEPLVTAESTVRRLQLGLETPVAATGENCTIRLAAAMLETAMLAPAVRTA